MYNIRRTAVCCSLQTSRRSGPQRVQTELKFVLTRSHSRSSFTPIPGGVRFRSRRVRSTGESDSSSNTCATSCKRKKKIHKQKQYRHYYPRLRSAPPGVCDANNCFSSTIVSVRGSRCSIGGRARRREIDGRPRDSHAKTAATQSFVFRTDRTADTGRTARAHATDRPTDSQRTRPFRARFSMSVVLLV